MVALCAARCVPYSNPPLAEIENLGSLREVMDAQATISDPLWSHIDDRSIGDRDWPTFADAATRLEATAARARTFDGTFGAKAGRFDELADRLETGAAALGMATHDRDAGRASQIIDELKNTCDECHKEFR